MDRPASVRRIRVAPAPTGGARPAGVAGPQAAERGACRLPRGVSAILGRLREAMTSDRRKEPRMAKIIQVEAVSRESGLPGNLIALFDDGSLKVGELRVGK